MIRREPQNRIDNCNILIKIASLNKWTSVNNPSHYSDIRHVPHSDDILIPVFGDNDELDHDYSNDFVDMRENGIDNAFEGLTGRI